MASCQQQKLTPPPPPQPQTQNVTVTCKAYSDLALGIDNGNVKLVIRNPSNPTQTWEKVTFVGYFHLVNNGMAIARPDPVAPGKKVELVVYNPLDDSESIRWSHADIRDVLDFTPIFTAKKNHVENILNWDVNPSTLEVVVQKPNVEQSQLWNMSIVPV